MKKINELINILVDGLTKEEITLNCESMKQLLDYITNLQEENKELEEDKSKMFETAVKRNNQLLDRIDKAIEYVKNNVIQIKLNKVGTVTTVSEKFDKDEFLDILQGEDKE